MQHFVIGHFGLITGLDQGFVAGQHQLGGTAAQHGLLTEQIGLGLFAEGGGQHAAARSADAVGISQRPGKTGLGGILMNGDERRHTTTLLELATHQAARALGRNQHHIKVFARGDLLEVDVEAVRKQQHRVLGQLGLDLFVQLLLRDIRHQHRDQRCADHGLGRRGDVQAVFLGLLEALALAYADDDLKAAVLKV